MKSMTDLGFGMGGLKDPVDGILLIIFKIGFGVVRFCFEQLIMLRDVQ